MPVYVEKKSGDLVRWHEWPDFSMIRCETHSSGYLYFLMIRSSPTHYLETAWTLCNFFWGQISFSSECICYNIRDKKMSNMTVPKSNKVPQLRKLKRTLCTIILRQTISKEHESTKLLLQCRLEISLGFQTFFRQSQSSLSGYIIWNTSISQRNLNFPSLQ